MKKVNIDWKALLPNLIILFVFILASAIYFWPSVEGKVIYASDNISATSASQECMNNRADTGVETWWTNSMFSGMPTYQIGGGGRFLTDKITRPLKLLFGLGTKYALFILLYYLFAFFLLMRAFNINKWLSMAGAFAIALSSYFLIIIAAAHLSKCYTITWFTLVVVGFLLCFRQKYLWGAFVTMFFTYVGFYSHPQMGYYICLMIAIFGCAELAQTIKNKTWKQFGISVGVFAIAFLIGLGTGSANFFANQEYSSQTMRGGHSDLVKDTDETNKTTGLDLDYATAWSYGINETMTFLIPNYMGGASGYNLGKDSQLEKNLKRMGVPARQAKGFCQSAPTYWGEKPFTSGPVYMGAIIIFLFVLGLIIVQGPYKWALLVATLFSVALAWGRHFMPLTELFFNYFPVYNKFRAVESILIVAEITVPILGFLALKAIAEGTPEWKKVRNSIFIAGGATGLVCLLIALASSHIDVTSSYDAQWKGQVGDQIYRAILDQRQALISADAWRSLLFVLLGVGATFVYALKRYKTTDETAQNKLSCWFGIVLTALIVIDMWTVDKRYCNDSLFVPAKERDKAFKMLPYEKQLLESDTTYYRVLNLTTNTFNDARTSYYLKSVGGYSAAKLRRYQDLIDEHISRMHMPVLNMLNTKYIISKGKDGQPFPYLNPDAFGNAWLVDDVYYVNNANDESDALNTIDLRHIAVADTTLQANAGLLTATASLGSPVDAIELVKYYPHKITYSSITQSERLAVFSEIYYPYGWKATIDGQSADIYRVNYMLRALLLPAGEHQICFVFDPDSIRKGNIIAVCCLAIILMTLIAAILASVRKH